MERQTVMIFVYAFEWWFPFVFIHEFIKRKSNQTP